MQRLPNGNVKSPLSPSSASPTPQQVSQQFPCLEGGGLGDCLSAWEESGLLVPVWFLSVCSN